jgi:hypothetical protein
VDIPKSLRALNTLGPPRDLWVAAGLVGCAKGRFVGGSRTLVECVKDLRFSPGPLETEGGI